MHYKRTSRRYWYRHSVGWLWCITTGPRGGTGISTVLGGYGDQPTDSYASMLYGNASQQDLQEVLIMAQCWVDIVTSQQIHLQVCLMVMHHNRTSRRYWYWHSAEWLWWPASRFIFKYASRWCITTGPRGGTGIGTVLGGYGDQPTDSSTSMLHGDALQKDLEEVLVSAQCWVVMVHYNRTSRRYWY